MSRWKSPKTRCEAKVVREMESGDTNLVQVVGATEYWAWEQEPSEDQVDAEDQQIDLESGDTNLVQVVGATEYWAWE